VAVLLVHTLNPFGFAWGRRFNEDNVDLNRNFLSPEQTYAGAPPLTNAFRNVLAPKRLSARLRSPAMGIGYLAMRHGRQAFWETLPVGQYEHPDWLCFGGRVRSQCADLLERFLPPILDSAGDVVHLDFHTGLGPWGVGQLLLPMGDSEQNITWWKAHFGAATVRADRDATRSYKVRGGLGEWLQVRFPRCKYRFATAEFGTYSPFRMLRALLNELHVYTRSGVQSVDSRSRRQLSEAFVPKNAAWRGKTLDIGLDWSTRALELLSTCVDAAVDRCSPLAAPNM
jgi:hypothetical protein